MIDGHEGHLYFMTDPICSWCWGTLPHIFQLREVYAERLSFSLKCAGLQVGSRKPLSEAHRQQLIELWQEVAETTGQRFAFELPTDADFVYHSELACRAIQIARRELSEEPWQIFHQLQHAFYVDCENVGAAETLYRLVGSDLNLSATDFEAQLHSDAIIHATRDEFTWCEERAIQALPTVFLDLGKGPKLVTGGFATADMLMQEIQARLTTH